MIFEDVHWVDPTSLETLGRTVDRITALGVLLIVTYRPEFEPPWIGRSYVTALTFNRLGQREIAAMIDRVAGNKALSARAREDIIERTDGIPLFAEEMTKAVMEADCRDAVERTLAAVPSPSVAVPASLHASLMARLDRLGSAKEVAQIGAAIGREFSHALLAAVVRKPEAELASALDRLVTAGLLFRQGLPPYATYLFKHALVLDAAYGTLLREPRRALRARIADTLESQFTEIAENQPELLARHYTEAGLIEKAAGFWGKAGQRSLERSALVEALGQFTRALEQIAILPTTPALRREEIKLRAALIHPLTHVKGYAAPETKAAVEQARLSIERAEALGEPAEDPLLLFSILYGLWIANCVAFNGGVVRELAEQFMQLAEKQATIVPLMVGHRLMGMSLLLTGGAAGGRTHLDQALTLYDPEEHRLLGTRFGQDVGVAILSFRSLALWILGYPDAALADSHKALNLAREIGQAATLMSALTNTSLTLIPCGSYEMAMAQLDELVALANEKGTPYWKARGMILQGCLLAMTDMPLDAVKTISSGLSAYRATGATVLATFALSSFLPAAYAQLGQFDNAWHHTNETLALVEETNERWCEPEVYRIAGELELMSPGHEFSKSANLFRARTFSCAPTTGKILGTPRSDEYGPALARPEKGAASSRTTCSGLWLVQPGLQYARSKKGQSLTGRIGVMRNARRN